MKSLPPYVIVVLAFVGVCLAIVFTILFTPLEDRRHEWERNKKPRT